MSIEQDIECFVNAPHNCVTHSCSIDGTAGTQREEREPTGFSKPAVVHNHAGSGDSFILNTHVSHCRSRLEHLYPAIPPAPSYAQIAASAVENAAEYAASEGGSDDEDDEPIQPPPVSYLFLLITYLHIKLISCYRLCFQESAVEGLHRKTSERTRHLPGLFAFVFM
jgi:hypothetical protein